jgi:hypothetical protein
MFPSASTSKDATPSNAANVVELVVKNACRLFYTL